MRGWNKEDPSQNLGERTDIDIETPVVLRTGQAVRSGIGAGYFRNFRQKGSGILNRSGLQYALTGGVAASYYGRPRTTLDVDVLVVTEESELTRLAKPLTDEGIKAGTRELLRAWKSKYRIASVVDSKSPHRLGMIFTDERLDRKAGSILGAHTYYQTAESLILSKLRVIKATLQPERVATDRQDVKAILKAAHVNLASLRRRARSQSTLELLGKLARD